MNTPDLSSTRWRRSKYSGHQGGDCVEIASVSHAVAVRDSKDPDGPVLSFTRPVFRKLAQEIRAGQYDQ